MGEDNDIKKKDLTVGGVSGSKKMRLGRVHKKKTEETPEAVAAEPKAEVVVAPAAAPASAPEAEEAKPVKKAAAKKKPEEAEAKPEEKPAEEKKPAKKAPAA